ncbi:MAG: sulfatase [Balneolales bacterium]
MIKHKSVCPRLSVWAMIVSFITLTASMTAAQPGERSGPSPNLILIIADDMAWDDCGACGHPNIKTPNIDRLAGEGMKFHKGFITTSSCSPSRASILTGTYPHQTDAEQLHWEVPAEKITFVEQLKEAGYWTAQAGKWHLGNHMKDRFDFLAAENTRALRDTYGKLPDSDGSGAHLWVPLLEHRPADQPFFLWLAAVDPHRIYEEGIIDSPHSVDDVILPPYVPDTETVRKDYALYYDEISRMDQYIGRVMETLERQGVSDNTMILFISDNGRPFPGDKTTLYDRGIKTPWFVKWPDRIPAGTQTHSLVSSVDIAPTFLSLAGLEPGDHFVGNDFSPVLSNVQTEIRTYVYGQAHWHDHEDYMRSVRDARFNYIRNFFNDLPATPPADALTSPTFSEMLRLKTEGRLNEYQVAAFTQPRPEEELYDLENDPHELHNLAGDPGHQEVLTRMRKELNAFMVHYDDGIPRLRTPDEFHRITGRPLPNNELPRRSKKEMFGDCDCLYRSPDGP